MLLHVREKVGCENMDKIPFKLITFLLNLVLSFCIWSFVLREQHHKKAEHIYICFFLWWTLDSFTLVWSPLYTHLPRSSFMEASSICINKLPWKV